ncbi:uncharacterized protein [Primulina huaijiensis]|uniref:uncharacterized protein n=1 Tax=Primulina huaijiensis TaxID=1492673 RepID=UPI003CC793E4
MAFLVLTKSHLLVSVVICFSVSFCKFGRAFDYPHLGAAGVFARGYLPEAEGEGQGDQYFPEAGLIGTNPALLLNEASECFNDKHIYSSCNEAYRLTQTGELSVPPEYTDQYCNGPCIAETRHVLDCVDGIVKNFLFFNRATLSNLRDVINGGCSYGPKRGNFNVAEHFRSDESSASKAAGRAAVYVFVLVMMFHILF